MKIGMKIWRWRMRLAQWIIGKTAFTLNVEIEGTVHVKAPCHAFLMHKIRANEHGLDLINVSAGYPYRVEPIRHHDMMQTGKMQRFSGGSHGTMNSSIGGKSDD